MAGQFVRLGGVDAGEAFVAVGFDRRDVDFIFLRAIYAEIFQ